jgi:predicted MFS family arabinose efflux permease
VPRLLPAVLREEPQFRLLFTGHALSMVGDRITFVALPFAVLSIGGGVGEVGLVITATTLPFALFSLLGGVWADRLPRHRVMLVSDLVRMVSQALSAFLLLSGSAEVWHLAALGVVFGASDAFFMPALTGLMPALVPPERLQEANAMRALVLSFGMVTGPAIAGVLVATIGPGGAIAIDAATFAASSVALARLRPGALARLEADRTASMLADLRAGFAEIRRRAWVQGFLVVLFVYSVAVLPAIFVLGPVLAEEEMGGVGAWAIITAAFGAGSVVGDLLILRFKPSRPLLWAGLGFTVASCQALVIGSGLPVGVIAGLEAVTGVAVSAGFGLWETTLQEQIPEHAISRVASVDHLVSIGLMPIGLLLAGPLAALIGIHETLYLETAIGVPVALAVLLLPEVRSIRRGRPAAVPGAA